MASGAEYPLGASRHIDVPSIAGVGMSSVGFTALMVELAVRGWWGFMTSGWDLLIILGWQGVAAWLSWWAYGWADGWWKALAALGVGLSVVALVVLLALLAFRVLVEFPDLLEGDSKQRKGRRSRGRHSRRRRRRY